MNINFRRQFRIQQIFLVILTMFIFADFIFDFSSRGEHKLLQAERLDIVEEGGQLALSFSNSSNTPYPIIDGQIIKSADNRNFSSIVFYEDKGDEVGGMAFF